MERELCRWISVITSFCISWSVFLLPVSHWWSLQVTGALLGSSRNLHEQTSTFLGRSTRSRAKVKIITNEGYVKVYLFSSFQPAYWSKPCRLSLSCYGKQSPLTSLRNFRVTSVHFDTINTKQNPIHFSVIPPSPVSRLSKRPRQGRVWFLFVSKEPG